MQTEHATFDANQKNIQSYVIGLGLSLLLTFAAFALVQLHLVSAPNTYIGVSLLAVTQLIVQSICFLRMNTSAEGRWNLLPFLFSIFIIAILVGGSLWIMYNLNYNMMH